MTDRQPVYAQTGFEQVRGTSDIGATYIEISIEAQHMWYYEDGQLYMDTDVVTGKGGNHTKRGVGYIHNKARNATLVGADYVSFVKYWMKVWGGIGIHDASLAQSVRRQDLSHQRFPRLYQHAAGQYDQALQPGENRYAGGNLLKHFQKSMKSSHKKYAETVKKHIDEKKRQL